MNILTVVFTLLMMLSILTYGRLHTFLNFSGIEAEYRKMFLSQRNPFNDAQDALYTYLIGKESQNNRKELIQKKEKNTQSPDFSSPKIIDEQSVEDEQKNNDPKVILNSTLYIGPLLKKADKTNELKIKQTRELFKRLIEVLYSQHEFYQEMLAKRPDFVDQLINSISDVADRNEFKIGDNNRKKERFQKKEDLSTMELDDPELQHLYYKMLHGTRKKTYSDKEYLIKDGYVSLLEFITLEKTARNRKLSVYLASGEMLKALYGDDNTVQQIIDLREDISREMKRVNPLTAEEGKKRLENAVKGRSYLGPEEDSLIEFNVSTSNPKLFR